MIMSKLQFRKWGERDTPCLGCPDRCIGCHGQDANGLYKCERYGEFKALNEAEYQARKEYIRQSDEIEAVMRGGKKKK